MIRPLAHRMSLLLLLVVAAGCGGGPDVIVVEHTDYNPPAPGDDGLPDDDLKDKTPTFDPELVDRRPEGDWLVNQSAAVIQLDVRLAKPDSDQDLLALRPSYAAALAAAKQHRPNLAVLPSVNQIDGKAKQFDDGLYAAIDQALFPGHVALVQRLLTKIGPQSPAAPYLAAALTVGGHETTAGDKAVRDRLIQQFNADSSVSKPIGFYTWNATLRRCWAFMRFLQQPLAEADPVAVALVQALEGDAALRADYDKASHFYGRMTNPLAILSLSDLLGVDVSQPQKLQQLRAAKNIGNRGVAFFPSSTTRETLLFDRLFPEGMPNANLMRELVKRIRSGQVDLAPREDSGWYDHQVFALETLLLAERGKECEKLLLTRPYKKRMLEAFEALITKRRETHVRQMETTTTTEVAPPRELEGLKPRLRVEPCPTYYLRTATAYNFLHEKVLSTLPKETLAPLHGLKAEGQREPDLAAELTAMRDLFYGLYLVSCEDIGLRPVPNQDLRAVEDGYAAALKWLETAATDPDLAADTRVAVPIYSDPQKGKMRLWVTLGVRLTQLDTRFVRPPSIKPAQGGGDWKEVEPWKLQTANFLIAVDEFAEIEIPSLNPPTRDELRKLCDEHKTKAAITTALAR